MFVYNVSSFYQNDSSEYGEPDYIIEYVTHEEEFTREQFKDICNDVLSQCKHEQMFEFLDKLKQLHGFKDLICTANFEFVEEE